MLDKIYLVYNRIGSFLIRYKFREIHGTEEGKNLSIS